MPNPESPKVVYDGINFKQLSERPIAELIATEGEDLRKEYQEAKDLLQKTVDVTGKIVIDQAVLDLIGETATTKINTIEAGASYKGINPGAIAELQLGISTLNEEGQLVRDPDALVGAYNQLSKLGLLGDETSKEEQLAAALLTLGKDIIDTNTQVGVTFGDFLRSCEEQDSNPTK